jgi:beta-N-acetylhexosaminidase
MITGPVLVTVLVMTTVQMPSAQSGERGAQAPARWGAVERSVVDRLQPHMKRKLIPFGPKRLRQTARYSDRLYGERRYRLKDPRVIVEHYTDGPSMMSAWWTMANNSKNLGESPGVCAHFIVSKKGKIFRVVPTTIRCRHTIGLNQTAIGIEHVGYSSASVFRHEQQRRASYRLTLWLMAKYDIAVRNVIGHGESLHSPLRYERYRSWRCLTHVDFSRHAMKRYRHAIRIRAHHKGLRIGPKPNWVDPKC